MRHRLLAFAFVCCHPICQEPAFTWLDAHGFADPSRLPFVRITVGERVDHGFLSRVDDGTASILTVDCEELTLRRGADVDWRESSFEEFVRQRLRTWKVKGQLLALRRSETPTPSHATTFVMLAWAADHRGARDRVAELKAAATALYGDRTKTLAEQLADDVTRTRIWRLALDFGRPEQSLQELRAGCEAFVERYPDSRFCVACERWRDGVTRLEARAGADAAADPLAQLTATLWQQNGHTTVRRGHCDVFADPRGASSPAARLVAVGERAIPHLITALDATEPSRSLAWLDPTFFSHRVLTTGQVAQQVFARITAYEPRDAADAARWWRDFEARGAAAVYTDGTLTGDAEQARRLLGTAPEVALVALTSALTSLPADRHAALIEVLSGIPDEQVDAQLRHHLRQSPDGRARLAAATALCLRGATEDAIDGLIAAFRTNDPRLAPPEVGRCLVATGRRRALSAVLADFDRVDDEMLQRLASGEPPIVTALRPDGSGERAAWHREALEPGFEDDIEQRLGELVSGDSFKLQLRAAPVLAQRWPLIYAFDRGASIAAQRAMLAAIDKTWRERRGPPGK